MVYFIIIRGGANTGKTTLVNRLKKKLNAELFHLGDTIRKYNLNKYQKHNLKIDRGGQWIPKENYIRACDIIIPRIIKLLNNNKIVIIEDNFYHKEVVDYLLKKIDFKNYIFSLKSDIKTCFNRGKSRNKLTPEKIIQSNKLANRFMIGHEIDTTDKNPKQITREVLKILSDKKLRNIKSFGSAITKVWSLFGIW